MPKKPPPPSREQEYFDQLWEGALNAWRLELHGAVVEILAEPRENDPQFRSVVRYVVNGAEVERFYPETQNWLLWVQPLKNRVYVQWTKGTWPPA